MKNDACMQNTAKRKRKKFSYADIWKGLIPWKGDSARECIRKIIFLIAIIVFGVCAFLIYDYYYVNNKNQTRYESLQQIADKNDGLEPDYEMVYDGYQWTMLPSQKTWININPDTVGYIYIKDTLVSYPVVQKTNQEERNYYLDHDFWNEESEPGAIYLDWRNSLEAETQSDNLIIYGHNMHDGTMFGQLKKYKDNHFFYGESPIITLSSNYQTADYKIFGFFLSNADFKQGEVFEYYNYINFNTEEEFYEYVNGVKLRSLVVNDVDVKYGDKLVTLSTCSGAFDEARLVIVGRMLREGEAPLSGTENNSRNPNPLYPDPWYKIKGTSFTPSPNFVPYG